MTVPPTAIAPVTRGALTPAGELGQRFAARFGRHLHWWIYLQDGDWLTEKRYPLSSAQLWEKHQNPFEAVGVRPGNTTDYALIDIDAGSQYRHRLAPVIHALEAVIGDGNHVLISSSDSGGLHLYLGFPEEVGTWALATALHWAVDAAGLDVRKGQLEIFPNLKSENCQYQGHRLPLQPSSGSFLLDSSEQPISDRIGCFLDALDAAAQTVDMEVFRDAVAKGNKWFWRRRFKRPTEGQSKLEAWRQDYEQKLARGLQPGQVNELVGHIARAGHVFLGYVGKALECYVWRTLEGLPGYRQHIAAPHCIREAQRHVKDWLEWAAKAIAAGKIFHRSSDGLREKRPDKRMELRKARMESLQEAVAIVEGNGEHYSTIRALAARLNELSGVSLASLYKPNYLPLWHPEHKPTPNPETAELEPVAADPEPPSDQVDKSLELLKIKAVLGLAYMKRWGRSEAPLSPSFSPPAGGMRVSAAAAVPASFPGSDWLFSVALRPDSLGRWPTGEEIRSALLVKAAHYRQAAAMWRASGDSEGELVAVAGLKRLGCDVELLLSPAWDGVGGLPFWVEGEAFRALSDSLAVLGGSQDAANRDC